MRQRLNRPWVAPVLLAVLTAAMTLWLWHWAVLNHSWGNDEELYRHFAGGMSRDFGLFIHMDPSYGRGIQRLHLLLLAVPLALFENPTAFIVAHFLFVAVYASAAIPAWLIARGCGLHPLAALIPAVLVVLTPWAVVTTSFLAEPIGYGVFAWLLWALWRAATRPSAGADLLAVALMGLALVARTGFLLLLPLLPVLAVLQAWRFATEGTTAERMRRLPSAAFRRQPFSVGLGLVGGVILLLAWTRVLPGGPERFTGSYATSLPPLWLMASKWRSFLSRVDAGTGFLMFAVAVPWIVARIARPREPGLHALAWIGLLASFSVLLALVGGPADERYVMFLGFTVPVVGAVALLRAQVGPLLLLLGSVPAFWLFFNPGWHLAALNDFDYFSFPTESFMGRVVLGKLHQTPAALLLGLGLLAAVALAARRPLRRWLPLLIVPAALFQLTATGYAVKNHVNSVGARYGPDLKARAWVDAHVAKDEHVGLLAVSDGLTGEYNSVWREIQYWNRSPRAVVKILSPITFFESTEVPYPFGTQDVRADLDLASGAVHPQGQAPFPRYLVLPKAPLSVVLGWTPVAHTDYIPATLVRVKLPLQARTTLAGVSPDGHLAPGTPAVITVYRAARPLARCLRVDLLTRSSRPGPDVGVRFRARHGERSVARGPVPAGHVKRLYLPVTFAGATTTFEIDGFGRLDPGIGRLALQIGDYETLATACPS